MSNTETQPAHLLELRMQKTFDVGYRDYQAVERNPGPVPTTYLNNAIRIIDNSGIVPQLEVWHHRKTNAGRKAYIPWRGVLVLFLLSIQTGAGITYQGIANLIHDNLTVKQFDALGIRNHAGDEKDWYNRLWQSANRMLTVIDPYPTVRNKRLKQEEYEQLLTHTKSEAGVRRTKQNMARLDWLCEQLVHASVRMLPKDIREKYRGNIAIDATVIEVSGRVNPMSSQYQRGNADPFAGRYRRGGSHDGQGATTDLNAYELENGVMVWNKPGDNTNFLYLTTCVSFHQPGRIIGHGAKLIKSHERLGFSNGLVLADRAYNGERIENFHLPLRTTGWELVIDYRATDLGLQTTYKAHPGRRELVRYLDAPIPHQCQQRLRHRNTRPRPAGCDQTPS